MKLEHLVDERDILRKRWHDVRTVRLELKKGMVDKTSAAVMADSEYKRLKKEQKHISKMIKHIEHKITRAVKNGA